jgi:hypothetical protein
MLANAALLPLPAHGAPPAAPVQRLVSVRNVQPDTAAAVRGPCLHLPPDIAAAVRGVHLYLLPYTADHIHNVRLDAIYDIVNPVRGSCLHLPPGIAVPVLDAIRASESPPHSDTPYTNVANHPFWFCPQQMP